MSYSLFIGILLAGAVFSVVLGCVKIFKCADLSWCAVPLPFLAAWVAVTVDYVWVVIRWHQ